MAVVFGYSLTECWHVKTLFFAPLIKCHFWSVMADKKADLQEKKEYAKLLFIKEKLTQKEISVRVGVSERTLSKWVNENSWEQQRKSTMLTREEQLRSMLDELVKLNDAIKNNPRGFCYLDDLIKAAFKNDTEGVTLTQINQMATIARGYATKEQAYIRDTLVQNIERLEREVSATDAYNVAKELLSYWRSIDLDKAKMLADCFDPYIKSLFK